MLIDARTVPDGETLDHDICIIGAGAAGLTIARQLVGRGLKVCIAESGGLEFDAETQALYEGENVGLPYFALDSCRLRYFGGTTNHWSGYCLRFKEWDFEAWAALPNSGWPIGAADLAPWYEGAVRQIGLPQAGWDVDHWEELLDTPRLPLESERFVTDLLLIRPLRMGQTYRAEMERAADVTVYLHATAVELESDDAGRQVSKIRLRTLAGNQLSVTSRFVVLAAGGLENARLLLASNRRQAMGLGNQNDLVGRYFMDHAGFVGGIIKPSDPRLAMRFYRAQEVGDAEVQAFLLMTEDTQREEQIQSVPVLPVPVPDPALDTAGVRSLGRLRRSLLGGRMPDDLSADVGDVIGDLGSVTSFAYSQLRYGELPLDHIACETVIRQVPNPDSRVTLADARDPFGMPRVRLDWRLTEFDRRSVRRTLELLGMEVGQAGLGRLQIVLSEDDDAWPEDFRGSNHHIGTTRMADEPKRGVVDRDCKVHGLDNLYVAGSSVFPTAGIGTPTLMIVALALRLADHLAARAT